MCGDVVAVPDDPSCPPPKKGAPAKPGVKSNMEAYSEPLEDYSRITFCNRFFNNLLALDFVTEKAKKSEEDQKNLENWNNRARLFLHEVTHLNYFMNAPAKSPVVDDAYIAYKDTDGKTQNEVAYGPYNVKVLRNYRGDAWYPGQNADTFAWYAMAMWAKKEIGHYPPLPTTGGKKPTKAPRRGDGTSFTKSELYQEDSSDVTGDETDHTPAPGFTIPGCSDIQLVDDIVLPVLNVSCVDAASSIPSGVFSSSSNRVYDEFCRGAYNNHNELQWTADAFGNLVGGLPLRTDAKRALRIYKKRDGKPEQYTNWHFKLDWVPNLPLDSDTCFLDCPTAFETLAATPLCSQKGDTKNLMSMSGQIDVGCGSYGYTVEGVAIS